MNKDSSCLEAYLFQFGDRGYFNNCKKLGSDSTHCSEAAGDP